MKKKLNKYRYYKEIINIEEQVEKMRTLSYSHKLYPKSNVEQTIEREYTSRQDKQDIFEVLREDVAEEIGDSSPRQAHTYLAQEEKGQMLKAQTSDDPSYNEAVDYLNEIDRKIKEIEEKRKQDIINRNQNE